MRISELFTSIQGESSHAGRLCTFVRTTGCDQRCSWCDTAYAFEGGEEYSLNDLYERVTDYGVKLVQLTGGEPLTQPDALEFMTGLCDLGYEVLLETGGSQPIDQVDPRVKRIVDLKPPGSGMTDLIHWPNIDALKTGDEVKFVIANRADFEWSREVIRNHNLVYRAALLMSPAFGLMAPLPLTEWIISERLPVRMQLQLHKYIWPPETQGV